MRGKLRARFDILVVFDDGYVRMTSDKTRSLPPAEIVKCLREYADMIDNGIKAGDAKRARLATVTAPSRVGHV
jgi:hypothetical protein